MKEEDKEPKPIPTQPVRQQSKEQSPELVKKNKRQSSTMSLANQQVAIFDEIKEMQDSENMNSPKLRMKPANGALRRSYNGETIREVSLKKREA